MNMEHVRFENTLSDLRDCQEHMDDKDLSEEEKDARHELIEVCWRIAKDYAGKPEEDDDEESDDGEPDDVELQHERAEERWREGAASRRYGMGV